MKATFRRNMWRRFAALILVAASLVSISCKDDEDSDGRYQASSEIDIRTRITSQLHLTVEAMNGIVDITGVSDSDSIVVLGERIVYSVSQQSADTHLTELSVHIQEANNQFWVSTVQPVYTEGCDYTVNYSITVPENFSVMVRQANGEVLIRTVGPVTSGRPSAEVDLANGSIELDDVQGSILTELSNGTTNVSTQYSDLDLCEVTVVNGTINMNIPNTISAYFSAQVIVGTVTANGLDLRNPVITPTSVTGRLGSGDGAIALRGTTGTITVTGN